MWLILWPSLFFLWTYLQRLRQKRQSEGDVWPLRSCVGSAHAQSRCHGVFKDILHFNATVKPEELQYARQWLILSGSFESLMSSSEHKHNWTWNHTCTLQGISRTSSPLNSLEPLLSVSCCHLKFCFKCPGLHSACNKTCMLNLLVCTSQCWTGWHPCFLEMIPCLHELAFGFFHLPTIQQVKKTCLKLWAQEKKTRISSSEKQINARIYHSGVKTSYITARQQRLPCANVQAAMCSHCSETTDDTWPVPSLGLGSLEGQTDVLDAKLILKH